MVLAGKFLKVCSETRRLFKSEQVAGGECYVQQIKKIRRDKLEDYKRMENIFI